MKTVATSDPKVQPLELHTTEIKHDGNVCVTISVGANAGTFTQIPNEVVIGAGFRKLSGTGAKLLVILWQHVNSEQYAASGVAEVWPSKPRLQYMMGGTSEDTVERALNEIVAVKLLVKMRRGYRHAGSCYCLMVPGRKVAPPTPADLRQCENGRSGIPADLRECKDGQVKIPADLRVAPMASGPIPADLRGLEPQICGGAYKDELDEEEPKDPSSGSSSVMGRKEPDEGLCSRPQKNQTNDFSSGRTWQTRWAATPQDRQEHALSLVAARYGRNPESAAKVAAVAAGGRPSEALAMTLVQSLGGQDYR